MVASGKCAEIILPLALQQSYSYRIPQNFQSAVKVGQRVIVQFGERKFYTGIVYRIHADCPEHIELKPLTEILDPDETVTEEQLKLWDWISDYYMCSLGEVFKAALPAGLKLESEARLMLNEGRVGSYDLSSRQELLIQFLQKNQGAGIDDLVRAAGGQHSRKEVKDLLEQGILVIEERLRDNSRKRTQEVIHPGPALTANTEEMLNSLGRASRQKELLGLILHRFHEKGLSFFTRKELPSEFTGVQLRSLEKRGFIRIEELASSSVVLRKDAGRNPFPLSAVQKEACLKIREGLKDRKVVLLEGVTSSGKTEIYIHLINELLSEGRQVLYLLPEIALTSQIVNRLREVFGNRVGVYHSRFSDPERVEVYRNLLEEGDNRYDLILGVRSSVFLPFRRLGLIIVDEEHENSFKQHDPAPRYNARDTAVVLGRIHKSGVLMGTATPSVESWFNARNGKYALVQIHERFGGVQLPEIRIADVRRARLKKQMRSVFTPVLYNAIHDNLQMGKQIILFQNRRGYSSFLECEQCGWIPYCRNCDVALTYHKFTGTLSCHYCGHAERPPGKCAECSHTGILTRGFGTELIEDEMSLLFPGVRIERLDLDSARSRKAYERILGNFESGETDILVGTQMLSKGLDFERVGLVGILNADQMLNFPDFRAFERSFQLMAQVSGRAGRKKDRGLVIIQSTHPEHPVLSYVIRNDLKGFYHEQSEERQTFLYPPYSRMIRLQMKAAKKETCAEASALVASELRKIFGKRVLGPHPPLVARVKNRYIEQILLKVERKASFARARKLLKECLDTLHKHQSLKNVRINIDVDPL